MAKNSRVSQDKNVTLNKMQPDLSVGCVALPQWNLCRRNTN